MQTTMKAVVCEKYGPPGNLEVKDLPVPEVGGRKLRIKIHAASMSFADILKVQGLYQVKTPVPFIPGTEVAGEIAEAFPGAHFSLGDRVMCVMTHACGGWAEEIAIDADRVLKIPVGMSYRQAACLPSAFGTSYYALKQRGELKKRDCLLVTGAGGAIGSAAVSIGKAMGAHVIAAASSEEKLAFARLCGADETINYKKEKLHDGVKRLTGDKGADVILDPVGGDLFEQVYRSVAWSGKILVAGFASGTIPQIKLNHVLLKGYDIRGVRYDVWRDTSLQQCMANFTELIGYYSQGELSIPDPETFSFDQLNKALSKISERRSIGKQVFTVM